MKYALLLTMLFACGANAEENPFFPPLKRITVIPGALGSIAHPLPPSDSAMIVAPQPVQSAEQRKKDELVGARMVAIIAQEEVWYKPEQGIYVRYPVNSTSVLTLETPRPQDDLQQIQQAISPPASKPSTPTGAKGKTW